MVLKIEPIYKAIQHIKKQTKIRKRKIILLSLGGEKFTQNLAHQLTKQKQLILICGHYEGVDERIKKFIDLEISIGPYVLTGGELPAMVIIDAVSRLIPNVLHNPQSLEEKRLKKNKLLTYPVYTRPRIFAPKKNVKLKVPDVLLSGNHQKIKQWLEKNSKEIKI